MRAYIRPRAPEPGEVIQETNLAVSEPDLTRLVSAWLADLIKKNPTATLVAIDVDIRIQIHAPLEPRP